MSKIQQGKMLRNARESLINPETDEYYTQTEFGAEINLTRETVSKWENKDEIPEKLVKLVKTVFNINPDYIRKGKEPMFLPPKIHVLTPRDVTLGMEGKGEISGGYAPGEEPEPVSESVIDIEYEDAVGKLIVNPVISYMDTDFVKLAVFKRTGAGNEMVGVEYEQIDTVVIPKKLYGAHLIPFKVFGESMEKLIMENSIVLVDTSPHDDIEEGKIYCFRIPYRGFIIRKVEKSLDGLYLIPYNKTFEERRIAWEEFNPEWVIGRVMWNIINPVGF